MTVKITASYVSLNFEMLWRAVQMTQYVYLLISYQDKQNERKLILPQPTFGSWNFLSGEVAKHQKTGTTYQDPEINNNPLKRACISLLEKNKYAEIAKCTLDEKNINISRLFYYRNPDNRTEHTFLHIDLSQAENLTALTKDSHPKLNDLQEVDAEYIGKKYLLNNKTLSYYEGLVLAKLKLREALQQYAKQEHSEEQLKQLAQQIVNFGKSDFFARQEKKLIVSKLIQDLKSLDLMLDEHNSKWPPLKAAIKTQLNIQENDKQQSWKLRLYFENPTVPILVEKSRPAKIKKGKEDDEESLVKTNLLDACLIASKDNTKAASFIATEESFVLISG